VPAKLVKKRFSNEADMLAHSQMLEQKAMSWNYCDPIDQL